MKKYSFSTVYISETNETLWKKFKKIAASKDISTNKLIFKLIREYVENKRDNTF